MDALERNDMYWKMQKRLMKVLDVVLFVCMIGIFWLLFPVYVLLWCVNNKSSEDTFPNPLLNALIEKYSTWERETKEAMFRTYIEKKIALRGDTEE